MSASWLPAPECARLTNHCVPRRRVFGIAYLMQRKTNTNNPVKGADQLVVKQIPFEGLDRTQIDTAIHEVKALEMLTHPNIVRYCGSWITDKGLVRDDPVAHWDAMNLTGHTIAGVPCDALGNVPDALFIMTDYADGGSLDNLMKRNLLNQNHEQAHLNEFLLGLWVAQLVLAIDHMHSFGVLHRDLKPANIFITKSGIIKVGDLGGAIMIDEPDETCESDYGSPIYICPEVWHSGICSHKSDVWSLGCVIYQLMSLRPPFEAGTGLVQRVLYREPAPLPEMYSQGLRDTVGMMLRKAPDARPSCKELITVPYVAAAIDNWMKVSCGATPSENDPNNTTLDSTSYLRQSAEDPFSVATRPPLSVSAAPRQYPQSPIRHAGQ